MPYPAPAAYPAPQPKGVSPMVSYAAIGIAVLAIILSLVIPGPAGPQGLQGPTGNTGATGPAGPAGAGTLMASSMIAPWFTGGLALSGCTPVLNVTLTVPRSGMIVVYATLHLWIAHTAGTDDLWNAQVAGTSTDCSSSNTTRVGWLGDIPAAVGSATTINVDGSFVNAFAVAAGSHTYYMNADMLSGQSAGDAVSEAGMVLVFYPA